MKSIMKEKIKKIDDCTSETCDHMPNTTGIPDHVKSSFEAYSGFSFDDVRVHYHSDQPAQLKSYAFTKGTDVYVAPNQERYLTHELGHVIQQKKGRVPSRQKYKGYQLNTDESMEIQADQISQKAMQYGGQGNDGQHIYAGISGTPVVQMAVWEMMSTGWKCITKDAVKSHPTVPGKIGDLYDDVVEAYLDPLTRKPLKKKRQQSVSARPVRQVAPAVIPRIPAAAETQQEYDARMHGLITKFQQGEELSEEEQTKLNVWMSNANHLLMRIHQLPTARGLNQRSWIEALAAFRKTAGHSVFTRDVDLGELKGQPKSGGTMSTVTRIQKGFGGIRSYADLNRGGGAGSYVRFVAEKKMASQKDQTSNLLNAGSIASRGITVLYDSVSVMEENKQAGHMAFNEHDSAGRVFGTHAEDPLALHALRRFSQQLLSKDNPLAGFGAAPPAAIPSLSDAFILENAVAGIQEMTRQTEQGQKPEEEYNEAILFSGAKIGNIKAILIHKPSVGPGRPGVMTPYRPDQIARAQRKADAEKQDKEAQIRLIGRQFKEIGDAIKAQTIGRVEGEGERSQLIKMKQELQIQRIPEVKQSHIVDHLVPSTTSKMRMKHAWEDFQIPDEIKSWKEELGYRGVPIRYLFHMVNPETVKRCDLPALAESIWQRGYAAWQDDVERDKKREVRKEQMKKDVSTLSITGISIVPSKKPSQNPAPLQTSLSNEEQLNLLQNNCLITAVATAALHRAPTAAEITAIRTSIRDRGFVPIGEMLYASEHILQIICDVLHVNVPINVHYHHFIHEQFFQDHHGAPITIYHRGLHFSDQQM